MQLDRRKYYGAETAENKNQMENSSTPSFLDQKINRRQALSTGAKAGIGVAAVVIVGAAGYLAYTSLGSSSSTTSSTTSTTTTTPSTTSTTTTPTTTASSGAGLVFAHWHFEDAQVTSYLQAFTKEFNTPVT